MEESLRAAGWRIGEDPAEAEVIVVNTCGFIEPAVEESIETILDLARLKEGGRCRRLIVAGCLPERFREEIVGALPEVDVFLGTGAFAQVAAAAEDRLKSVIVLPDPEAVSPSGGSAASARGGPSAYLKIAEGCARRCTYCAIPKLRGRHRSRPQASILAEAEALLAKGVRELVLVAQETTAYGRDLKGPAACLAGLLIALSDLSGEGRWIRFLYGHPDTIDDRLIETVASRPNICSYYDIPVQHASDPVLKRMGRTHSADDLHRLFSRIREIDGSAALRTTAIVGFPGETDQDFQRLVDFVRRIRFDHLGVFPYSDADDLPSHFLSSHVPPKVAQKRHDRLMALQREISEEKLGVWVGEDLDVLVENRPEPGVFEGRTYFQAPEVDGLTYVRGEAVPLGSFCRTRISDALEYDLVGEPRP